MIGPFQPVQLEAGLPSDLLRILHISEEGALWLQTEQEVILLRDREWEVALSDLSGDIVGVDSNGLLWVLDEDGASISSWDGDTWSSYTEEAGWSPLSEYSFIKDPPVMDQLGQVWLVTTEGLRMFDGQHWRRISPQDIGLSHPREAEEGLTPDINLKFLEGQQELWMGVCNWTGAGPIGGDGVLRFDGSSWRRVHNKLSSGCTEVIVEDAEGKVWIGLDGDVWRYDPVSGILDPFTQPPSPFNGGGFFGGVGDLIVDYEGFPWADLLFCGGAGCGFGTILYHFDQGAWVEVIQEDFRLHDLVIDQAGRPWLLTPGGIYEVKDNQPTLFLSLPINPASIHEGPFGQVWFFVVDKEKSELWYLIQHASD